MATAVITLAPHPADDIAGIEIVSRLARRLGLRLVPRHGCVQVPIEGEGAVDEVRLALDAVSGDWPRHLAVDRSPARP